MGNIGDPVSQPIPAVGTSGTTYATQINAFLTEMKTRLEALVPRASLASGDLDLNGEDLQNAGYLGLTNLLALPTAPNYSIQVYGGELYYVNASGAAKITDSGALNSAGIGAITGDYGAPNPAQFRFVDADQTYYAYDDYGTGSWAYLWGLGMSFPKNTTSTTRIRMIAPSTLASSYTLTLPDKPASTAIVALDSSGNLSTLTSQKTIQLHSSAFIVEAGATQYGAYIELDRNGLDYPKCWASLPVPVGSTLTQLKVRFNKTSIGGEGLYAGISKQVDGVISGSTILSASTADNAPGAITLTTTSPTATTTVDGAYVVQIIGDQNSPASTDKFYWVEITYTEPVV